MMAVLTMLMVMVIPMMIMLMFLEKSWVDSGLLIIGDSQLN